MQNYRAVHGPYAFFFLALMHLAPLLAVAANFIWGEQIRTGQFTPWACGGAVLAIIILVLLVVQYWWLVLIILIGAAFSLFQESRGSAILLFFVGIAAIYNTNKYINRIPNTVKRQTRSGVFEAIKVPWFLSLAITTTGLFAGLTAVLSLAVEIGSLIWSIIALARSLLISFGPRTDRTLDQPAESSNQETTSTEQKIQTTLQRFKISRNAIKIALIVGAIIGCILGLYTVQGRFDRLQLPLAPVVFSTVLAPTNQLPTIASVSLPTTTTIQTVTSAPAQTAQALTPIPNTKVAALRTTLVRLLSQHVALVTAMTSAGLRGRDFEFKAAAEAVDTNSVQLSKSIGSVYGSETEKNFLALWRKSVGLTIDYTVGTLKRDRVGQDKAINSLVSFNQDLTAFFTSQNPYLSKDSMVSLFNDYVLNLKDVVDAQSSNNQTKVFQAQEKASSVLVSFGDMLTDSIIIQFPANFR